MVTAIPGRTINRPVTLKRSRFPAGIKTEGKRRVSELLSGGLDAGDLK